MDRGYDNSETFQQDLLKWIRWLYKQIVELQRRMKDGEDNNLPKSTPVDFLNYAETYAKAGGAVNNAIGKDRYPEPIFYLFGQSIELSLKAYLLGQETPIKILSSRAYGHDLNALLDLASDG